MLEDGVMKDDARLARNTRKRVVRESNDEG